jgi:hypothetical protein
MGCITLPFTVVVADLLPQPAKTTMADSNTINPKKILLGFINPPFNTNII